MEQNLTATQLVRRFFVFYGTWKFLPCSQEPGTGSYPESDESNPRLYTPFLEDPF